MKYQIIIIFLIHVIYLKYVGAINLNSHRIKQIIPKAVILFGLNVELVEAREAKINETFQKAKNGEIELSQEPRAVKRRAFAACKNPEMLKLIQQNPTLANIDSKACLQKVLADEIVNDVNQAIKDLPNTDLIKLNKKYGDNPI